MAYPIIQIHGTSAAPATVLGQGPTRIPTGGKIRAGIKVLTKKAAEQPKARALYEQGIALGHSFDQIERAILEVLPQLKTPLVPRNVAWFTVRAQDFSTPETAQDILHAYGEDRGDGLRLYRFPVVFPSDHWQSVMPHELAAWGSNDKRYWSQYGTDGRTRHCMRYAPVPVDETGRRTIRIFGGRKIVPRDANGGLCEPEACPEYQQRQCNLSGRFVFFIPGIRSVSAFELHTNSFYAMNTSIQKFEAIGFLRGGRISGFLDRHRTTFYLTKKLMEVAHIDEHGQAVRVPQWIIDLEAPVDVTALMREHEDDEVAIAQAQLATQILEGAPGAASPMERVCVIEPPQQEMRAGEPALDRVVARAASYGVDASRYQAYADRRWGAGWKLNPMGRRRAWDELDRYANDAEGYRDKIESELRSTQC